MIIPEILPDVFGSNVSFSPLPFSMIAASFSLLVDTIRERCQVTHYDTHCATIIFQRLSLLNSHIFMPMSPHYCQAGRPRRRFPSSIGHRVTVSAVNITVVTEAGWPVFTIADWPRRISLQYRQLSAASLRHRLMPFSGYQPHNGQFRIESLLAD